MSRSALFLTVLVSALLVGCGQEATMSPAERGEKLFHAGKWDQAIAACAEAIAANPRDARSLTIRGRAYFVQGDVEQAIADFTSAIDAAPNDAEPYYNRALAYKRHKEDKKARADEMMARRLDPEYYQAFIARPENEQQPSDAEDDLPLPRLPSKTASKAEPMPSGPATAVVERRPPLLRDAKTRDRLPLVTDVYGQPVDVEPKTYTEQLLGTVISADPTASTQGPPLRRSERNAPDLSSTSGIPGDSDPNADPTAEPANKRPQRNTNLGAMGLNPFGASPFSAGVRPTGVNGELDPATAQAPPLGSPTGAQGLDPLGSAGSSYDRRRSFGPTSPFSTPAYNPYVVAPERNLNLGGGRNAGGSLNPYGAPLRNPYSRPTLPPLRDTAPRDEPELEYGSNVPSGF